MYPILEINLDKIYGNAKYVIDLCNKNGIKVAGVIKGCNALPEVAEVFIKSGCEYIADSRILHIKNMINNGVEAKFMLVRVPMLSEVEELVKYVNVSLNSEISVINKIEEECKKQNKKHKVVLMVDLGDLREGIFEYDEIISTADYIEKLPHVELAGIGTNLGCYGAIVPTEENLGRLVKIGRDISKKIGRELEIISGGASTSFPLLLDNKNIEGINNLRIGENILLGRDLRHIWGYEMKGIQTDTFILKAEVIEVKSKPSHPIGKLFVDAFGNEPVFEDRGIRKRALLGVGKQDFVYPDQLIPREKGIQVLGGSSDHTIIDIEECEKEIKVGDIIEFEMCYGPMLHLGNSDGVTKKFI